MPKKILMCNQAWQDDPFVDTPEETSCGVGDHLRNIWESRGWITGGSLPPTFGTAWIDMNFDGSLTSTCYRDYGPGLIAAGGTFQVQAAYSVNGNRTRIRLDRLAGPQLRFDSTTDSASPLDFENLYGGTPYTITTTDINAGGVRVYFYTGSGGGFSASRFSTFTVSYTPP